MKLFRCFTYCMAIFLHFSTAKTIPIKLPNRENAKPELRFTPNLGQFASYIKTKAEIDGGEFYFSGNEFVYHFIDFTQLHEMTHGHTINDSISSTLLKIKFLNANVSCQPVFSNPYSDHQNYFYGNNPSKWHTNVYAYNTMKLENFYDKIDMVVTSKGQDFKYDLHVKPLADLSKLVLKYEGAKQLKIENGELKIITNQNLVRELKPYAYQTIGGKKIEVACNYQLIGKEVKFKLGNNYDKNYELIIDPQLVFSSFTGSKADNFGYTATFDQDGNTYVGGIVYNYGGNLILIGDSIYDINPDSFPVSPGAYKTLFQGGDCDVVIFKFSKDGSRRLYATYLGGSEVDIPQSMIVNRDNQLIIFGSTSSPDFPITAGTLPFTGNGNNFEVNCNQLVFIGGSQVYLTILNETGSGLISSAKIGTQGNSGINYTHPVQLGTLSNPSYYNFGDEARGEVICDSLGNIYVATYTEATLLPLESSPKTFSLGEKTDAWVFKTNSNLSQLLFSKRFGGNGNDVAYGLQPDSKGNLFFAGHTNSADLIGTISGLNQTISGMLDAYVAKMDKDGNVIAATYLGTSEDDQAFFVQTDISDNVYVMGQTWSNNYPINANGNSPFYSDAGSGQFIHKLDNNLTTSGFSTVFGSKIQGPDISPTAFMVDNCGLIYVSGWRGVLSDPGQIQSTSRSLRLADQLPYNPSRPSGFYFAVFGKNMGGIVKGTYFGIDGVDHVDGGTSRFDKRGYIHQAICGGCGKFQGNGQTPTTPNVWSPTNRSFNCNMLGVKFDFETVDIRANFTSKPPLKNDTIRVIVGQPIEFNFSGQTISGSNVSWYNFRYPSSNRNNLRFVTEESSWTLQPSSPSFATQLPSFMSLRKWLIEVDYAKSEDCIQTDNNTFYIVVEPSITGANICNGDSGQFNVIGRVRSAKWIPIEGLSDPNIPNPKVWVPRDTAFTVELWANDNSYFGRYKKEVKIVNLSPAAFFEITTDTMGTFPHSILVDNQSASTNASFLWRLGDGNTLSGENIGYTYQKIGKYNLQLIVTQDSSACAFTDSISRNIYVTPKINEITFCPEKPFGTFTILGGTICQVLKENNTDCIKTFTFSGNNLNEPKVFVYSEFNQPYSYVFTVTAKATPYPATTYEYTTLTQADWNSADVTFTGLTKVKTKTWDVGLGNTFRDSVFVVNYPKTGTYDIKVSGIDTNNCQYSIQKEQIIEFMLIPNVFTPNNDGINDSFEIKGLVPNTASLEIFNRWGIKVYESGENAYLNNWKAENQTDGLYYYNFKLNYRPNKPYKGWVQVVR